MTPPQRAGIKNPETLNLTLTDFPPDAHFPIVVFCLRNDVRAETSDPCELTKPLFLLAGLVS